MHGDRPFILADEEEDLLGILNSAELVKNVRRTTIFEVLQGVGDDGIKRAGQFDPGRHTNEGSSIYPSHRPANLSLGPQHF